MIQYKNQALIELENVSAIGRHEVKESRKVLDKNLEVMIYCIGFLLFGQTMRWSFETEKERDFVWDNVMKELPEVKKLDNF